MEIVPVAPLVVIPSHQLHKIVWHREPRLGIKNAGPTVANEVARHAILVVAIPQHALHLPVGLLSDGPADLLVGNASVEAHGEVHQGSVGGGDPERHAPDLPVQGRDQAAHGLGSGCGARDYVEACCGSAAPVS